MARRLRLSSGSVLLSIAGVDCVTATDAQLLFNSGGLPYNGCLLSGRILHGSLSAGFPRTVTIPYGKTFSVAPRCMYGVLDPDDSYGVFTPNWFTGEVTGVPAAGYLMYITATVGLSSVTFAVHLTVFSGGAPNSLPDFCYVIFTT